MLAEGIAIGVFATLFIEMSFVTAFALKSIFKGMKEEMQSDRKEN